MKKMKVKDVSCFNEVDKEVLAKAWINQQAKKAVDGMTVLQALTLLKDQVEKDFGNMIERITEFIKKEEEMELKVLNPQSKEAKNESKRNTRISNKGT